MRITEDNGTYTCTIPVRLADGRVLLVHGRSSVREVAEELGFIGPDEVGGWFGRLTKGAGKILSGLAKNKSVRKAVSITKNIVTNPVTQGALGVLTGGASLPVTGGLTAALKLGKAIKGGGKKGRAAAKLAKGLRTAYEGKQKRKKVRVKLNRAGRRYRPELSSSQKREQKMKLQALKRKLEGKYLKKLSPRKKKAISRVLKPYVRELRFA